MSQPPNDDSIDAIITKGELRHVRAEELRGRSRRRPQQRQAEQALVDQLTAMGFSQEDASTALIQTRNNFEGAVEWLLGDREQLDYSSDDEDAAAWLNDPNVALLLSNPVIQNGLANPRVIAAFRDILESPESTERHLQDPEIGHVLLQVNAVLQGQESMTL